MAKAFTRAIQQCWRWLSGDAPAPDGRSWAVLGGVAGIFALIMLALSAATSQPTALPMPSSTQHGQQAASSTPNSTGSGTAAAATPRTYFPSTSLASHASPPTSPPVNASLPTATPKTTTSTTAAKADRPRSGRKGHRTRVAAGKRHGTPHH